MNRPTASSVLCGLSEMAREGQGPPPGARRAGRRRWRDGEVDEGFRDIPEEVAVALVHDATTYAVMMATPCELEDFGVGFSLTEGVIETAADVQAIEVATSALGVEVRMWLRPGLAAALAGRRRRLSGPTGCGLCGVESLEAATRPLRPRADDGLRISQGSLQRAMAALGEAQRLGRATHAVHAAGFWTPDEGLVAIREDVGRHNALDKLAGALARAGRDGAGGVILLTSRVSVEMVQKAAALGATVIAAISAPTTLAVATAESAGLTLVAVARADGFEVFTRPERIA